MRKLAFGVSNQVGHKQAWATKEDDQRLEKFGFRK